MTFFLYRKVKKYVEMEEINGVKVPKDKSGAFNVKEWRMITDEELRATWEAENRRNDGEPR